MTSLGPVDVPSTADVVGERLRRAIQIGSFLPGDRLPPERQFAVQLGISRVALREALRSLEDAGLLERAGHGSGGGALVVAARGQAVSTGKELRALRDQLERVFEFRLACEGAAAELAAARRDDADLERLDRAIEALHGQLSAGAFRTADNEFHLAVAAAARNELLEQAVEDARAAMFTPFDVVRFEVVLPSTREHHERIRREISQGRGAAAQRAMVEHVEEAKHEILAAIAIERPGP